MKVLPAVDILNRKCVQLVGGDPSTKIFENEDPLSNEVVRVFRLFAFD